MKVMLATEKNAKKFSLDWDTWDNLGRYCPNENLALVPRPEAFINQYGCSKQTAAILVLIASLHEFGHHFHKHTEAGAIDCQEEAEAWLYIFRCIKPQFHSYIWISFDYIFSDAKDYEIPMINNLRDLISIGLSNSQISPD